MFEVMECLLCTGAPGPGWPCFDLRQVIRMACSLGMAPEREKMAQQAA